jgi:hypothetical protein
MEQIRGLEGKQTGTSGLEAPTGNYRGSSPFSAVAHSVHNSIPSFSLLGLLHFLTLFNLITLLNLLSLLVDNPTIPNQALSGRTDPPFPTSQFLKLFDDIHPFDDFAENDMFPASYQLQSFHVW